MEPAFGQFRSLGGAAQALRKITERKRTAPAPKRSNCLPSAWKKPAAPCRIAAGLVYLHEPYRVVVAGNREICCSKALHEVHKQYQPGLRADRQPWAVAKKQTPEQNRATGVRLLGSPPSRSGSTEFPAHLQPAPPRTQDVGENSGKMRLLDKSNCYKSRRNGQAVKVMDKKLQTAITVVLAVLLGGGGIFFGITQAKKGASALSAVNIFRTEKSWAWCRKMIPITPRSGRAPS